jgi:hypothetical protein
VIHEPVTTRRTHGLRLYALEWLRLLSPLAPPLRGPLAQDSEKPDCFVASIEIDVTAESPRPLLDLLAPEGYRAERLTGGPALVLSVDALVPIEITLRRGSGAPSPWAPACTAAELEQILIDWHGCLRSDLQPAPVIVR